MSLFAYAPRYILGGVSFIFNAFVEKMVVLAGGGSGDGLEGLIEYLVAL